jgi:competence protein ComEA
MARFAALILAVLLALPGARAAAPAAVDANTATPAELETVRGIGPATSARIVEERRRGGPFRDLDDLQARVKGVGENNVRKMAAAGLTVGGRGAPAVSAEAAGRGTGAAAGGSLPRDAGRVETIVAMPRLEPAPSVALAASPGAQPAASKAGASASDAPARASKKASAPAGTGADAKPRPPAAR